MVEIKGDCIVSEVGGGKDERAWLVTCLCYIWHPCKPRTTVSAVSQETSQHNEWFVLTNAPAPDGILLSVTCPGGFPLAILSRALKYPISGTYHLRQPLMDVTTRPSVQSAANTGKRKIRRLSRPVSLSLDDEAAHGSSKRQKLDHPTVPPPPFWDRLSVVPLCVSALHELDRRNERQISGEKQVKAAFEPKIRRSLRLHAKRVAENHRRRQQIAQSLSSPTCLKRLKRLARGGGPDLSDLRGVSSLAITRLLS